MQSGVSDSTIEAAVQSSIGQIDPVDDNRGPAEFKKHAAANVLNIRIGILLSLLRETVT